MIIGITGKSGSGKTTLSNLFTDFHIINIDEISHEVLQMPDIKESISKTFNIDFDGINRVELGDLIFTNRNNMKSLSDLIWAKTKEILYDEIQKYDNVVLDWILLPHTSFFKLCNVKILMKTTDEKLRLNKILIRDNITEQYLQNRENNSIDYDENEYDYIIENNYKSDLETVLSTIKKEIMNGKN